MADRTIVSLALLKAQWDLNKQDYLETFVPLVVECIRLSKPVAISLPQLRVDMDTRFGLTIPQHALKLILNRVRTQGYVKAENKTLFPVYSRLEESKFAYKHQQILESHSKVIKALIAFCLSEYQTTLTQSQGEIALHTFLQADPFLSVGKLVAPELPSTDAKAEKTTNFMVAAFIQHIENLRSAEFEHLETIVKGSMLATALYLPDPGQVGQKFHNTDLYFDTSFVIYALGHAGPARRDPCLELLSLLETSAVRLSCFSHTYDEVCGALTACVRRLEKGNISGAYGASMEYFLSEGIDADEVSLRISYLERDLQKLKIHVRPSMQGEDLYQIDEGRLRSVLQAELFQLNEYAIDRDVKSLSSIMRLWKDQQPMSFEHAPALLVTTNGVLAKVARTYFAKTISTTEGEVQRSVSPCITDHNLTTLLWLKKPTQAPNIPRQRLIADCLAAMQPSRELWTKYESTLSILLSKGSLRPDDYYLMRYSREAKRALMEETTGDEDVFVEGTVAQVMERARKAMMADTNAELTKERELRIVAEGRLLEERAKREEELSLVNATQAAHEQQRQEFAVARAKRYAYRLTLGLHVMGLMILALGIYSVSVFPGPGFQKFKTTPMVWAIVIGGQVFVTLFSIVNMHYGLALKALIDKVQGRLEKRIAEWLLIETPLSIS